MKDFRPSWWDSLILVLGPILMGLSMAFGYDPSVAVDTTTFIDTGFWEFLTSGWGMIFGTGGILSVVRGIIAGWRRNQVPSSQSSLASKATVKGMLGSTNSLATLILVAVSSSTLTLALLGNSNLLLRGFGS